MATAGTYSIVAFDPGQGSWGVACQSKFLAIGAVTPWAEANVGAIATQAWIKVSYGPDGLDLLRQGVPAAQVVERLTIADPGRDRRQLAVVDRTGQVAAFTGSGCLGWAGGSIGDGYAVQGNMLVSNATVDALAERFEATAGEPLAERLVTTLAAGQAAGGDRRGQQAAALLVVRDGAGYDASGVEVSLRVDDHRKPIVELERLLRLHRVYFGSTPDSDWLAVDDLLGRELRERLTASGYTSGDLTADLEAWAGVENLEERVRGAERIDPIVLRELRRLT